MAAFLLALALVQADPSTTLRDQGLRDMGAYSLLRELTKDVGSRLSGSEGYEKAVNWGESTMKRLGFQNVRRLPNNIPHWVRGKVNECMIDGTTPLTCVALGGSVGGTVEASVIEVKSIQEAATLGDKAKGKIIFYNGPMDPTNLSPMGAYGGAVSQRTGGASAAAKVGAVAVLVRSMTMEADDVPHTGTLRYESGVAQIPAAALSIKAAERLSAEIRAGHNPTVRLKLDCQTWPDVESASVMGELVGSEKPDDVIVMGGHLDSWDLSESAHDDGAGIAHSLEALRLIKSLGTPKRTIRVVLFADEEQRGSGAAAYLAFAKRSKQRAYAGIESDSGGFMPRGFSTSQSGRGLKKLNGWLPEFQKLGIERFNGGGGGGADVGPLKELGAALFGLSPDLARYFDYHHSAKDTLERVSARELEFGAIAMALLAWNISEKGL